MPGGTEVSPEALHAHAGTVARIAADVDQARGAAAHVTMGREAYGVLCQFLPGMFEQTQSAAVDALRDTAAALDDTAAGLRAAARDYTHTDAAAAGGLSGTFTYE